MEGEVEAKDKNSPEIVLCVPALLAAIVASL